MRHSTEQNSIRELIGPVIKKTLPYIIHLRHELHSKPEIGLETINTKKLIEKALHHTSLKIRKPLLGNDFIAELKGNSNTTICLRADMDGLPLEEVTGLPYKSDVNGKMHACGHDGHTAILIGTALVLEELKNHINATIRFVFQPGEEVICQGRELVKLGVCTGVQEVYALHGWPGLPEGSIACKPGPLFAAAATFHIKVNGKGCHGAMPNQGLNPLPIAAEIVNKLSLLHHEMSRSKEAIISVCSITGGDSSNIIPGSAYIQGTVRYLNFELGKRIEKEIRFIAENSAQNPEIDIEIDYKNHYNLPLINTEYGYHKIRQLAMENFAENHWRDLKEPLMVAEDFSFYLPGREGAMFLLGLGTDSPGLHSPSFDFNDHALYNGILMFSLLALTTHGRR